MPDSDPLLVATDLDGTLLRADHTVSSRTRAVVAELAARGIPVVPVTARQPKGLRPIASAVGLTGPAICGNGAIGMHLAANEIWFARPLAADDARTLALRLRGRDPSLLFASVGPAGEWFRAEPGYAVEAKFADHHRTRNEMELGDLSFVVLDDCAKLIVRRPGVAPEQLIREFRDEFAAVEATTSGAPFVEIMGAGVTKASALELLCGRLGVARERVWAFGDAPNDVDMLRWAGRGFAVANASAEARAAADELVGSNENDGVASAISASAISALLGL